MSAKATKSHGKSSSLITKEQWSLPVSFNTEGRPISLEDYIHNAPNVLVFSSLSEDQRAALAAKRIDMLADYEIATIGAGVVNKEQALNEVRSRSKLGRTLIEIQMRVITHLIHEAGNRS